MAEKEGFEPPEACTSTVFKTAAFDHSATSPSAPVIAGQSDNPQVAQTIAAIGPIIAESR